MKLSGLILSLLLGKIIFLKLFRSKNTFAGIYSIPFSNWISVQAASQNLENLYVSLSDILLAPYLAISKFLSTITLPLKLYNNGQTSSEYFSIHSDKLISVKPLIDSIKPL